MTVGFQYPISNSNWKPLSQGSQTSRSQGHTTHPALAVGQRGSTLHTLHHTLNYSWKGNNWNGSKHRLINWLSIIVAHFLQVLARGTWFVLLPLPLLGLAQKKEGCTYLVQEGCCVDPLPNMQNPIQKQWWKESKLHSLFVGCHSVQLFKESSGRLWAMEREFWSQHILSCIPFLYSALSMAES